MKINKNKMAVFDLDDTLYTDNSHIKILCDYYKTQIFKSFIFKIFGKVLPKAERKVLYHFYNKIPQKVKSNYILEFSQKVVALLKKKQNEGYFILIVSNAPKELLIAAANYLKADYLDALPYKKAETVQTNYTFNYLFVCTDNKSDIDLLSIADEAVITCKKKNINYFIKRLKKQNYTFLVNDNV